MASLLDAIVYLSEAERDTRKDRDTRGLESELKSNLERLWGWERRAYLNKIRKQFPYVSLEDLTDTAEQVFKDVIDQGGATVEQVRENTTGIIGQTASAGGNSLIADVGVDISFKVRSRVAEDYLQNRAGNLIAGIDDTTRQRIRTLVHDGVVKGESYTKIANDLDDMFDGFSAPAPQKHIRNRAELVTVTEIGEAYEVGREDAAQQIKDLGLDMEKRWLTVGDARVDDIICRLNGEDGWIPFDDVFSSGHARPLGHPGCRCDMLTRVAQNAV